MSISTVNVIMGRVSVATPDSPIAVFIEPSGDLNACFGATIRTKKQIADKHPGLVGVFHNEMKPTVVKSKILNAINKYQDETIQIFRASNSNSITQAGSGANNPSSASV